MDSLSIALGYILFRPADRMKRHFFLLSFRLGKASETRQLLRTSFRSCPLMVSFDTLYHDVCPFRVFWLWDRWTVALWSRILYYVQKCIWKLEFCWEKREKYVNYYEFCFRSCTLMVSFETLQGPVTLCMPISSFLVVR